MAIQAITIPDHLFARHVRTVDFIKRYVFPGSCIPSISALSGAMTASSDLRLVHLSDITPHYARTLRAWRENVFTHPEEVRSLGYSDEFLRLWEFYLCYCEASFAENYNRNVQMVFVRPRSRLQPDPASKALVDGDSA
jgi:cyclopropane-fatty-acyl-phospholipid synthase